jgi:chitodextrinase
MGKRLLALTAVGVLVSSACTVHQDGVPSVSGPAEFALSLKMSAIPDRLLQDGSQFAKISVTAFDATGKAVVVPVHLDAMATVGGTTQAFGALSANTVTTGTDANNPASVTYTPPTTTIGNGATVTIFGSLIGANSVNTSTQQVSIVVTPAVNLAGTAPNAVMTASPVAPAQSFALGKPITFSGSGSCGSQPIGGVCPGTIAILTYTWTFGDGTSATGATVTHSYSAAGTFTALLTVTNDRGLTSSASQSIVVAALAAPTAVFVTSPTTIKAATTTVNFNASKSTAGSGRSIVRYDWNFGDGTTDTQTSTTTTHVYAAANVYTAALTVTDDTGQTNTVTGQVTVTP